MVLLGRGVTEDTEYAPTLPDREEYVLKVLRGAGLKPKKLQLGLYENSQSIPFVVLDHRTYPGIEAHLFTIADSAMWIPELTPAGDIILYEPSKWYEGCKYDSIVDWRIDSWGMLLGSVESVMEWLEPYRESVTSGIRPDTIWAHHEVEWWTALWEIPENEPQNVDDFIKGIDESISPHIKELNVLGFATTGCCSGMALDHPDSRPMLPYVVFDDESYFDAGAHLFTLADMAGWTPIFGAHGYDVFVEYNLDGLDEEYIEVWGELVYAARKLGPILKEYRSLVDEAKNTMYAWDRRQRDAAKKLTPKAFEED
ncbi:MAG: hypothetical protein ACW977_06870 [Candidatus Thorarchaeota archaeon]